MSFPEEFVRKAAASGSNNVRLATDETTPDREAAFIDGNATGDGYRRTLVCCKAASAMSRSRVTLRSPLWAAAIILKAMTS
jgi:hypothetical protein